MKKGKKTFMQNIRELKLWKKRPVYLITIFFSMLVLMLAIRILWPCREYEFEGNYRFMSEMPVENAVIYEGISLNPGVWRIELEYEADTDLAAVCNVADGTVFSGGLLSNGEPLYSALTKTGYDIWLYEATENLQVVISYIGQGSLATGNLKIIETNQLWTMLLTIVIFAAVFIYSAMIFYYYDKEYAVDSEKKNVFFFVTVIALIISIPYLCGYNITGADLTYHLRRIEGVKDGLLGGQFPVRLEPRWLYDHGYANAIFYCNTFLYFPAMLRLLGFSITASYNAYCVVLNFATAWISYYCFSRIFGKRNIGTICSALYTLSIFRIYKLIITSATGEGSAVTFIPLVLYGLYRVFTEDPKDKKYKTCWISIMIGYAGLIQTHVLTCEITALVTILYCIFFIRRIFCLNTFLELAKGAALSLLLSLWFLVPFLDYYMTQDVHIRHVSARTIQERGLHPAHLLFHFWTTGINTPLGTNGMQYSHPVGIGLVLITALGIFLLCWFSGAFQKLAGRRLIFAKVTAFIGTLLLLMSLNGFPWDRIQSLNSVTAALVSSLQFPNRFLGWGTACMVMLFGFCFCYFEEHNVKLCWAVTALAVIGITTSSMYLLDFVNCNQEYYELYNEEGMGFGYISGAEYLVEGTDEAKLTFATAVAGNGVEIHSYAKGYLQAELDCTNLTSQGSYVDVPLLLYKGYCAVDTVTGQSMQVCAGENNTVRVLIPADYDGNVKVRFVSPVYWRISELISAVTIIIFAVMWWKYRRRTTC